MSQHNIVFPIIISVAVLAFAGNAYYQKRKKGFVNNKKARNWYYGVLWIAAAFFLGCAVIGIVKSH